MSELDAPLSGAVLAPKGLRSVEIPADPLNRSMSRKEREAIKPAALEPSFALPNIAPPAGT